MSAALAVFWLALQAPAPAESAGASHVASVRDTLREIRARSEDEEHERALELARVLVGSPQWQAAREAERAEGWYLLGVSRERAAERAGAVAAFRSAAALAGPGELRLDSLYNAGAVRLADAEQLRLRIPEVRSRLGLPPLDAQAGPAGPLSPAPGKRKEGPDDIELARGRYREARAELALRLRAGDPFLGDVDTRANLELIQRRLRELDEIRRQREEQEAQQQEPDPKQEPQEQSGEPQDEKQQEEPKESESQERQDREGQQEQQPEPSEPEKEQETQAEDQRQADPREVEERLLSREEVQRLLDQLEKIDEKARAVRAALQSRRRVPVERDW